MTLSDAERPIVQLQDVRLTLASTAGPVDILRGIDLEIAAGESVGILGPSGSGQSTLLAVLAGLEKATASTVTVPGPAPNDLSAAPLALGRRAHEIGREQGE